MGGDIKIPAQIEKKFFGQDFTDRIITYSGEV